jgi:hypothetical protein
MTRNSVCAREKHQISSLQNCTFLSLLMTEKNNVRQTFLNNLRIASNGEMINEWWSGRNFKGSRRDLIEIVFRKFPGFSEKTIKRLDVPAEIGTEDLLNIRLKPYGYANPLNILRLSAPTCCNDADNLLHNYIVYLFNLVFLSLILNSWETTEFTVVFLFLFCKI